MPFALCGVFTPSVPTRPRLLPETVPAVSVDLDLLRKLVLSRLKNGASAGPSGWTGELVAPLVYDEECLACLAVLVEDVLNGVLPDHARDLLLSSILVPVGKHGGGVRPIAVSECLYKLTTMYAMDTVRSELPGIFEPVQLGVGAPGGSERAVHIIQAALEASGKNSVLLKCDLKNAFNERNRSQILQELFKYDNLRPLWRLAHWAYRAPSSLLVFDRGIHVDTISSEQGVKQGDCLGSFLFSLSVHPLYLDSARGLDQITQVAIADDRNLVGPPEQVFTAFENFDKALVTRRTGLTLRKEKCGLLWPHPEPLPEAVRALAARHGVPVSLGTMETLGALVGRGDDQVSQWLAGRVQSHDRFFTLLCHDDLPVQIAMLLLRMCAIPMMGYLARVIPPRLFLPHARTFDARVLDTAFRRLRIPQPLPDVATTTLLLPIRLGGFGLRPVTLVSTPAFLSAAAQAAQDICSLVPVAQHSSVLLSEATRAPFASDVANCLVTLRDAGLGDGPIQLLPANPNAFWQEFGKTPPERKLQRALCGQLESILLTRSMDDSSTSRHDKQRLISLGSRNAGAWLTCFPSCPELTLSDTAFRAAARFRLGLRSHDDLPAKCECGFDLVRE